MSEFDIYGIFVPGLLVFALLAAALTAALRRLLVAIGFYRLVWHPALFDVALFIVVVGAVFVLFNADRGGILPILGTI
jgi:hypothetical protein